MKRSSIAISSLFIASLFVACGESNSDMSDLDVETPATEEVAEEEAPVDLAAEAQFRMDMIISNNIAAPAKLLTNMKAAGMEQYVDELMVGIDGVDGGPTHTSKALLLGVIGADVSYIAMHERHAEALPYLGAMKALGDELGCGYVLSEEMLTEFEAAQGDDDKLVNLVYDQYYKFDEYLRANDRIEIAAHVLTGGLVESLHQVTGQLKDAEVSENAATILMDEKNSLNSIIGLYSDLERSEANKTIVADLQAILEVFDTADLATLNAKVEALRSKMVAGSLS